jgi:hypothetical protein
MPSLADSAARDAIIQRISSLPANATGKWGTMTAPQMLAHVSDALRMAYGDLPCKPRGNLLSRSALVQWLVIDKIEWPKGAKTAPELLARPAEPWEGERAQLIALVRRFEQEASRTSWPSHPMFGALSGAQWGRLGWKHLNHHLTQFGA